MAIIFDDELRPETTGVYCRTALQGLAQVQHVRPADLPAYHSGESDLYLRIDDGLDYRLPDDLHPSAWWAIDTHLDFERSLTRAKDFDFVFAAQRDGAERLRQEGVESATWLPLACDPDIHRRHEVEKQFDVCFVGNELPGPRADLLRLIQRKFLNSFVGQRYMDEMAKAYSASRVVFNRSVRNDINMRVFEALSCGSFLMTNDLGDNGQNELFRPGVHLETYRNADELIDKTKYYLEHEDIRERIAATGREEATSKNTYRHRMQRLLGDVERRLTSCGMGRDSEEAGEQGRGGAGETCSRVVGDASGVDREESKRRNTSTSQHLNASTVSRLNAPAFSRDQSYFDHHRPELLALVPESARRVLDIGCASGRLGEAIKKRQAAQVTGIELDDGAAQEARTRLDDVRVGNVEEMDSGFDPKSFDCIVCGDILEHLVDTERLLTRARAWLAPAGRLVASIPNVRHHSVVRSLLDGNWTYESAGLLDRDHVRFFTRRDIERVFQEAGYLIDQIQVVPGPGYDEWEREGRPGNVRIGRLHVGGLTPEQAEEFYVYQFLVVASPQAKTLLTLHPCPLRERGVPTFPLAPITGRGVEVRGNGRMHFTQNFITDFDAFDFRGEPFAFVRFADGECAICDGRRVECQDGWTFDGAPTPFAADLNASLRFNDPDYFIGISDTCCDRAAHDWFLKQITAPLDQVTFSNIFVNWNYRRFRQLDLSRMVIVANDGGDIWVPDDLVRGTFDIDRLVTQLLGVDRPILLAAGPASCVIAHKYWMRADPAARQTIVDVGSAIDELTKRRKTRQYQIPGTRTAELICTW